MARSSLFWRKQSLRGVIDYLLKNENATFSDTIVIGKIQTGAYVTDFEDGEFLNKKKRNIKEMK